MSNATPRQIDFATMAAMIDALEAQALEFHLNLAAISPAAAKAALKAQAQHAAVLADILFAANGWSRKAFHAAKDFGSGKTIAPTTERSAA